jgi:hypothetical protein
VKGIKSGRVLDRDAGRTYFGFWFIAAGDVAVGGDLRGDVGGSHGSVGGGGIGGVDGGAAGK